MYLLMVVAAARINVIVAEFLVAGINVGPSLVVIKPERVPGG